MSQKVVIKKFLTQNNLKTSAVLHFVAKLNSWINDLERPSMKVDNRLYENISKTTRANIVIASDMKESKRNACRNVNCHLVEYLKIFHPKSLIFRIRADEKGLCRLCREKPGFLYIQITTKNSVKISNPYSPSM